MPYLYSLIATVAAYVTMFLGMTWYAQRVFRTPYQWRRVATASGLAVALLLAGKAIGGLPVALVLTLAYPLVLLPLGFYEPPERALLSSRLLPARARGRAG